MLGNFSFVRVYDPVTIEIEAFCQAIIFMTDVAISILETNTHICRSLSNAEGEDGVFAMKIQK